MSYQMLLSEYSSNLIEIIERCFDTLYEFALESKTLLISLPNDLKLNERSLWLHNFVFESEFLPYASYALMSCSAFCLFLVLQNVKISYPDLIEESGSSFKEIGVKTDNLSPLRKESSRADRSNREDLRSFATNKAKEMTSPSPLLTMQERRELALNTPNSHYDSVISPSSLGGSDYYSESEGQSIFSDDIGSEMSDNHTYDFNGDSRIKESVKKPEVLLGWQINIRGRGVGVILDIKKSLGRTTKFYVRLENGNMRLLALKRSDKKGQVPFSLISKVAN